MLETLSERAVLLAGLGSLFLVSSVMAAPRGVTLAGREGGAPNASAMIDGRSWTCGADGCRAGASATADSQPVLRECQRAAAQLGPFTRYETGAKVLAADDLAACNRSAHRNPATEIAGR